jgi:cytochrome c oxidase assembly protein subunit 11
MHAGETREMPVVFYVDPALAQDAEQNGLNTITLSYTYFPVRAEPVASAPGSGRVY